MAVTTRYRPFHRIIDVSVTAVGMLLSPPACTGRDGFEEPGFFDDTFPFDSRLKRGETR
jgi:hypothetical protein